MNKFIKVCDSIYGGRSCIYRYVNPNQIVDICIAETQNEITIEATLTSGKRVVILEREDLINLVGEEYEKEITDKIKEIINEKRDTRY